MRTKIWRVESLLGGGRVYWGAGEVGKILLLMHKFIQQILILVSAQAKILLVALEVCGG